MRILGITMAQDKRTQAKTRGFLARRSLVLWTVALTIAAGCLLIPRLGQRHLWEDEAVTALLAQNTLRFGVPVNWDGSYLISFAQISANKNFLEVRTPWLPYFLLAAVYGLLGTWSQHSTWVARLPFTLCAVACVPVFLHVVQRFTGNRRLAILSAILLTLSVNFLLYGRQSRYYPLGMLLTLGVLWAYTRLDERPRLATVACGLFAALLFHTHYVAWATFGVSLAAASAAVHRSPQRLKKVIIAFALSAVLAVPWLIVVGVYRLPSMPLSERFWNAAVLFVWYLRDYHALDMMPLMLLPAMLAALVRRSTGRWQVDSSVAFAVILIVVTTVLCSVFTPQRREMTWHSDIRYTIHLLPLFSFLQAAALMRLWQWKKLLAPIAAGLLLFTNLLSWFPVRLYTLPAWAQAEVGLWKGSWGYEFGPRLSAAFWEKIRFPLPSYLHEITHDVAGPYGVASEFLRRNAQRGDEVMTWPPEAAEALRFSNPHLLFCHRWRPEWGARPAALDHLPLYVSQPTTRLQWIVDFEGDPDRIAEVLAQSGLALRLQPISLGVFRMDMTKPEQHRHAFMTPAGFPLEHDTLVYRRADPVSPPLGEPAVLRR